MSDRHVGAAARGTMLEWIALDPASPPGPATILVVDDDPSVLSAVTRFLLVSGYTVVVARSGAGALHAARSFSAEIHLVVTDLEMPGTNGIDLLHEVAGVRPTTRALLMSGGVLDAATRQRIAAGEIAFIAKPFRPAMLLGEVRELLQSRGEGRSPCPAT